MHPSCEAFPHLPLLLTDAGGRRRGLLPVQHLHHRRLPQRQDSARLVQYDCGEACGLPHGVGHLSDEHAVWCWVASGAGSWRHSAHGGSCSAGGELPRHEARRTRQAHSNTDHSAGYVKTFAHQFEALINEIERQMTVSAVQEPYSSTSTTTHHYRTFNTQFRFRGVP